MSSLAESLETKLESFAHDLVVAIINLELHSPYSSEVQETLQKIVGILRFVQANGIQPVRVELQQEQITVASRPQVGASLQARKLLNIAAERNLGAIEFGPGIDANELLRFLVLLTAAKHAGAFAPNAIERALETHGIHNIAIETASAPGRAGEPADSQPAIRGYQDLADCLQESHVAASRGESIELSRAAGVVEQAMQQMDREPSGLLSLAYYDDIDSFTVGHSVRVALLTLQVARAAGADEPTLLKAGTAALLHDIGKSRIPQSVLFKQGPLDDEEWNIMALHPRLGAEILIEQPDIDPTAIGAAFCHHMGPNQRGYPKPVLPFRPSGISRLVRVVDVFEALTSVRPYKPALTPVEAYVIMHRSPEDFDAKWLRCFVDAIGLYPLGTRLTLSNGDFGMVIGHGPRQDQPRIKLLHDGNGNQIAAGAPTVIVAGEELDGVRRDITAVISRSGKHTAHVSAEVVGHEPCC